MYDQRYVTLQLSGPLEHFVPGGCPRHPMPSSVDVRGPACVVLLILVCLP